MAIQDVASFVGAAAWLYPIYVTISKKLTKLKIKLTPIDTIQLGYTTLGPIINMSCAISAEKRDAIIERIELEVCHEDGDTHTLTWKTLDEIQYQQFMSFAGEGGTIGRSQPAIVLKVSTTMLSEKKIGFWDVKHQEQIQGYNNKLIEQLHHLRKIKSPDIYNNLFKTREFTDLNDCFVNGMYWKIGNYTAKLSIFVSASSKSFTEIRYFSLDNENIESLKVNTRLLEQSFRNVLTKEAPPVVWGWIYPKLKKEKK